MCIPASDHQTVLMMFLFYLVFQKNFGSVFLSLMQSFVMMVGEINYQDNFLKPYLNGNLPFPMLTFIIFIGFVLLAPILLVNLLVSFSSWVKFSHLLFIVVGCKDHDMMVFIM